MEHSEIQSVDIQIDKNRFQQYMQTRFAEIKEAFPIIEKATFVSDEL